jgi:hypothetical protein
MRVRHHGRQRLVHLVRDGSRQFRKARRLARARQSFLSQAEFLLHPDLAVDVQADDVPLHDGAFGVAHRRRTGLDPAIFAVETPQAVPAGVWFSRA